MRSRKREKEKPSSPPVAAVRDTKGEVCQAQPVAPVQLGNRSCHARPFGRRVIGLSRSGVFEARAAASIHMVSFRGRTRAGSHRHAAQKSPA
jgi:hypothetical protein